MSECKACWWQESGRCYHGDPPRDEKFRSKVMADGWCENWKSNRKAMEHALPAATFIALSQLASRK